MAGKIIIPQLLLPNDKPFFGDKLNYGHWSTRGLVGYWPFREASNLIDFTANENHGVFAASAGSWEGAGYHFASNTNGVALSKPISFAIGEPWTLIYRAKAVGDQLDGFLFGDVTEVVKSGIWHRQLVEIAFYNSAGDIVHFTDAALIADLDVMHTYVLTVVGSDLILYRDGVWIETQAIVGNTAWLCTYIGSGSGPALALDGVMEHASIYSRDLSTSEIAQLYRNPNLPIQREPVFGFVAAVGTTPKGPLTHPLYGPFAGPIAC